MHKGIWSRPSWLKRPYWLIIPYGALICFLVIPLIALIRISFSRLSLGQPPYEDLFHWVHDCVVQIQISFENYVFVLSQGLYRHVYWNSLMIAAITTLLCLVIGFPMAYGILRARPHMRMVWLGLAILPFWTSFLVRVYAWMNLLSTHGVVNEFLMGIGVIKEPLGLLHNDIAVGIGMVYSYLPFMIFPLYVGLTKIEPEMLEAAFDLGCRPITAFWRILVPLSRSGIFAGASLVFIPAVGEYLIPEFLGGPTSLTIGRVLWFEFFTNRDWPVACSLATLMIFILLVPMILIEKLQSSLDKRSGGGGQQ